MGKLIKKIAALILPIGLMLTGCGPTSEPTSSPTSPPTSTGGDGPGISVPENVTLPVKGDKVVHQTKLVTYDGPDLMETSKQVDIKVNGESLFVYETRVNNNRKFTWEMPEIMAPVALFDFEGKVSVEISIPNETITTAHVSPIDYGIATRIENNTIKFNLTYPSNYVIEYNNDPDKAIHLFANPIEDDPITEEDAANDPSIVYIGPGLYKADAIPVDNNTTIYIAGGAYVYGQIRTEGLENVEIRGHGIISGNIFNRRSESEYTIPVEIRTTKNILIKDITFLDPAGWTIALYKSEDIRLENIKIISARQNGDGISVQSCKNVEVIGGFVRTWDDSLVVKNEDRGTTHNVKFEGVTVWTDLAQSMEVGYETYGDTMDEITFQDITIIHNFHKAAISIHNCDDADITNVTYKNITLEDGQMLGDNREDGENDFLIDFTIAYNMEWTQSQGERGTINGVNIENIKVLQLLDTIDSRMNGESDVSKISNVSIKGLEIEGNQVKNEDELKLLKNDYTENITFETIEKVTGAQLYAPYSLNLGDNVTTNENIDSPAQTGMIVPDFAVMKGELSFIGKKASGTFTSSATHGTGTKTSSPADDGSGPFEKADHPATYAADNNKDTYYETPDWKGEDDEFAALTITFDRIITVGVIRVLGNIDNDFFFNYTLQIWGQKIKSDGSINKSTRIISTKEYQMTPSSGNAIDINITTQEYASIQLRLYKTEGALAPKTYQISEIECYPPSLSFNKAIVDATEHFDVYTVDKVVDGEKGGTSYYESAEIPAYFVVDLGGLYNVNTFGLFLPPSLMWNARTQEIEILGSDYNQSYSASSVTFKTIVEKTAYLFNPATGNRNLITLDSSVSVRYIKVVISSNDISAGYKAQLSEFCVYGD